MTEADRIARRDALYLAVGRAVHTSQMLETQLRLVLAVLKDELEVQIDYRSLAARDNKEPLGKLIAALRAAGMTSPDSCGVLSEALAARNRIVHQFFVRNVDATAHPRVFADAHAALVADADRLAAGATMANALLRDLCRAREVDDGALVVKQDRIVNAMLS